MRYAGGGVSGHGPIDVIGDSPAGALDEDLRMACLRALKIDRAVARAHAERFSWRACTEEFVRHHEPKIEHASLTVNAPVSV